MKHTANNLLQECRKTVIRENKIQLKNIIEEEDKDIFIREFIKTDKLNNLYNILEDETSKELLLRNTRNRYIIFFNKHIFRNLIKEFIFGIKYPVTSIAKWLIKISFFTAIKNIFYPREIGTWALFHIISMKQYYIKNVFEVKYDCIVFDIGAWKGDTAYYFSKHCNANAKIHCFEPDEYSFDILKKVCIKYKLNNTLQHNILFSDKKSTKNYTAMNKMSYIEKESLNDTITITVDNFVTSNNIEYIDFIKMDVEGAELNILKGAKDTIKKLRPALAVAIYHGGNFFFEDFITVPIFLKEITPNYKYYLRSFIPWGGEVILYCVPN